MKRFLLLLFSALMILNTLPVSAESTTDIQADASNNSDNEVYMDILSVLRIMDEATISEKPLTRQEFAIYVAKMLDLDIENSNYNTETYYYDVENGSVIHLLTELGIFNGTNDRKFLPNEEITYSQAVTVLVRALGYDTGNFTNSDYFSVAKKLKITDGVASNSKITKEVAAKLIYNTLNAYVGTEEIATKNGKIVVKITNNTEKTLMKVIFDTEIVEGVVNENSYTGLYDKTTLGRDELAIDDVVYKCNISGCEDLLGFSVKALVKGDSKDESLEKEIMYITEDAGKNKVLKVDSDDIIGFNAGEFSYYNEKGNKVTVTTDTALSLICNGIAVGSNYSEHFNIDKGSVTLIKNKNNNKYGVAIIEEIYNAIVLSSDAATYTVYTDAPAPYNKMDLAYDSNVYKSVQSVSSGQGIAAQMLSNGNLISIVRSPDGEYIKVYLCDETVEGKLSKKSTLNGTSYLTIDGVSYEVEKDFDPLTKYSIGDTVSYYLDIRGKIAAYTQISAETSAKLGYIYQMAYDTSGFNNTLMFKIYTDDGEFLTLDCAENVKFDGNKIKKETVKSRLSNFDGSLKRSVVMYKLNTNGEVNYIDTPAASKEERECENTLYVAGEEGVYSYFQPDALFMPYYGTGTQTQILGIPNNNNTNPTEAAFCTYKMGNQSLFTRTTEYTVALYKYNDDTPLIDLVTLRRSESVGGSVSKFADPILVDEIRECIGKDEEAVNEIRGLMKTDTIIYQVEPGLDISAIGSGDIITVARNGRGYICAYELLYDYSEDMPFWGNTYESDEYKKNPRYTLGTIDDIYINNIGNSYNEKSFIMISDVLGGDVVEACSLHSNNNSFMIYDDSRKEYKAYIGGLNDLDSYQNTNEKASKMFTYWRGSNRIVYFFYK